MSTDLNLKIESFSTAREIKALAERIIWAHRADVITVDQRDAHLFVLLQKNREEGTVGFNDLLWYIVTHVSTISRWDFPEGTQTTAVFPREDPDARKLVGFDTAENRQRVTEPVDNVLKPALETYWKSVAHDPLMAAEEFTRRLDEVILGTAVLSSAAPTPHRVLALQWVLIDRRLPIVASLGGPNDTFILLDVTGRLTEDQYKLVTDAIPEIVALSALASHHPVMKQKTQIAQQGLHILELLQTDEAFRALVRHRLERASLDSMSLGAPRYDLDYLMENLPAVALALFATRAFSAGDAASFVRTLGPRTLGGGPRW